MNFDFSEDQKMLREQLRKFLDNECPLSHLREIFLDEEKTHSPKVWQGLAQLGVLGAAVPENYGGSGLGMLELCVAAEECGRALAPIPFSSSVYLAIEAIKLTGTQSQKQKYLPKLAGGEIIGTFAYAETDSAPSLENIKTTFEDGKLNGEKNPVADGEIADIAIVVARSGSGVSLAIVELKDVERKSVKTIDPTRAHSSIKFSDSAAELLSSSDWADGTALLDHLLDRAAVLMAFEQLGAAERAMEFARDYANTRYAFGRPIGSFQAIKHKLADSYINNQIARSNCYYAAMILNDNDADLPAAAAAARLAASEAFIYIAQENVQIHGGIGFTWESDTQFFYRRAKLLSLALGGKLRWQERLVSFLEKRNVA